MIEIEPLNFRKGKWSSLPIFNDDYSAFKATHPGRWLENGARNLGLGLFVFRDPFIRLLEGLKPDGSLRLVQNALDPNRIGGWNIRVTAPESASMLWEHASGQNQRTIEKSHQHCIKRLFSELVRKLSPDDSGLSKIEGVGAAFEHFGMGKQLALRTDLVIVNVGLNSNGPNIEFSHSDVLNVRGRLESLYENELRGELQSKLGLVFTQKDSFQIQGVPENANKASERGVLESRLNPKPSLLERVGFLKHSSPGWTRWEANSLISFSRNTKKARDKLFHLELRKIFAVKTNASHKMRGETKKAKPKSKSKSQSHSH